MTYRVAVTGCFGFENTGDDAILETWLHDLGAFDGVEVIVLGANRTYLGPRYPGVDIRDWRDWSETIDVLASVDLLVVGGGGLFHDYCPMEPRLFMEPTELICPMTYLNLISWAKLLGRPCILTGVGVGPLRTEVGKRYVSEVLSWADGITVRDTGSWKVLQSIDFPGWDRVIVTADPVFRLPPVGRDRARQVVEAMGLSLTRPVIGVAIRNWMRDPPMDRWGLALAKALGEVVLATGGTVLFLPFQVYPPDEEANDVTAAIAVRQWMGPSSSVVLLSRYLTPMEADALVGACDVLIAMRLHALIMALRNAVPCISLAYDPKVRHVVEDAGLEAYNWDLASIESRALSRQVLELLERPEDFRSRAIPYRDEAVRRTDRHRQMAAEYLEGVSATRRPRVPLWASWVRDLWVHRSNQALKDAPAEAGGSLDSSHIPTLQAEVEAWRHRAAALQAERAALQAQLVQRDQLIQSITRSRAWLLVRFLWWLRPRVAPDGSRRQRALDSVLRQILRGLSRGRQWVRRLRRHQGPQPTYPAPSSDPSPLGDVTPRSGSGDLKAAPLTGRRVFIVAPALFDATGQTLYLGGAERYLLELVALLRRLGHEVQIYQPARGDWERQFYGAPVKGLDTGGLDKALMNEVFHRRVQSPDLTLYLDFTLAEPQSFTPSIGISHGVFWDAPGFQHAQQYASVLRAVENLNCVVSVDTNTINWVRTFSTSLAEKMVFLPNFVDLTLFRPRPADWPKDPHTLVILCPRRLHPSRGLRLLEELIPRITARYPHVVFWLVGQVFTDPDREVVESILRDQGPRVRWQTFPFERMPEAYWSADIALIPTTYAEGTSLACLEAMACGNAVLATHVGGLSDLIISGYNGLMTAPTVGALEEALATLIEQPDLRVRLGTRAREVAEAFSVERWRRAWTEVLRRFLVEY